MNTGPTVQRPPTLHLLLLSPLVLEGTPRALGFTAPIGHRDSLGACVQRLCGLIGHRPGFPGFPGFPGWRWRLDGLAARTFTFSPA